MKMIDLSAGQEAARKIAAEKDRLLTEAVSKALNRNDWKLEEVCSLLSQTEFYDSEMNPTFTEWRLAGKFLIRIGPLKYETKQEGSKLILHISFDHTTTE